ncbi:MAG: DUF4838 domain-containing protein [Candidatus Poribacteria bacterium]|jgi:hypothetical protein|nr:DUF4838 domain-containing protein [Candidatus Poribacteria bacterium]MDP6746276.1 DUF4838 domain-containing protein [Candidatus Poribacteria bacterium]MDP6998167.1 DUF4838 domain-containing protein [Candidatus Poribacteria bacterium]
MITAKTSIGLSHGIYDLLTNELGVVWGMANPILEEVPQRRTVAIPEINRTEKPAFGFRVFSGCDPDWLRRNRIDNGSRQLPFYGHGHNLYNLLPPSRYGQHAEYYVLVDGRRQVPDKDGHTPIQPCLTNPDVIQIAIETVSRFFNQNPEVSTYSLCPNESSKFCQCSSCLELDNSMEAYRDRRMNSNSYFYYINTVANELIHSYPDRYVSAYAYWTTELPSQQIDTLPSNVVIYLTQDSSQYYDPGYEARDYGILEMWSKVAHHLAVYDYYGLSWFTPRVYPQIVARPLRFLPTVGVKGFYCESYSYWAHTGAQLYLVTRLLWDISLDPDELMEEWSTKMFKEVAPQMRAYFDTLEGGWNRKNRPGKWFLGLNRLYLQLSEWKREDREQAREQIDQAYSLAENEITRQRVAYVRKGHRLAYQLSEILEKVLALRSDPGDPGPKLEEIFAEVSSTMAHFRSEIESDLMYGSAYYRGEGAENQLMWWKGFMGKVIEDMLVSHPDSQQNFATDATYRQMLDARTHPGVEERIALAEEIFPD